MQQQQFSGNLHVQNNPRVFNARHVTINGTTKSERTNDVASDVEIIDRLVPDYFYRHKCRAAGSVAYFTLLRMLFCVSGKNTGEKSALLKMDLARYAILVCSAKIASRVMIYSIDFPGMYQRRSYSVAAIPQKTVTLHITNCKQR